MSEETRHGGGRPDGDARPPFAVTVDIVIMTVREGALRVLLVQRDSEPFAGTWALPGGFVGIEEDAHAAAVRELAEETGVDAADFHLEQLATYSAPQRDPRMRVVSIAHLAFAPDLPDAGDVHGSGGEMLETRWWRVDDLLGESTAASLAFDHAQILRDALERVRSKIEYTTLASHFVAEPFTMAELRAVYDAVWGVAPDRAAFTRRVLATDGFVVPDDSPGIASSVPRPTLYRRGTATQLHPALLRSRAGDGTAMRGLTD